MDHVVHRHDHVMGRFSPGLRGGRAKQQPDLHQQAGQKADPDPGMCPDHQKSHQG